MSKRITKWELATYSRMSGEFTALPERYDTPEAACAAVGKKAWVHDHKIQEHVLYDPAKHGDAVRVDCGNTALEAYNHWTAAFRKECSELSLAWHSSEREGAAVTSGEKVVLLTGDRIQIHANQDVEWTMSGLNWGEFGKGKRSAVLVSYKPNDTVSLAATTKCGEIKKLTFVFRAREFDDSKAYNSRDNALDQRQIKKINTPMLEQIKSIMINIFGDEFKNVDISQITPEIVALVEEAANEIIYRSQGMLMMDIVFNTFLTGMPHWVQIVFSSTATMAIDFFEKEIRGNEDKKELLQKDRNAFATYQGWFKVRDGKRAYKSVIDAAAIKYKTELVTLLASQ